MLNISLQKFRSTNIPIDPYWAAATLASFRAVMVIFGSTLTRRFKRRPVYISCCGIISFGNLLMASYCFFNQDQSLTNQFTYAKWTPIIAIVFTYSGCALGFLIIPYMFQVSIFKRSWRARALLNIGKILHFSYHFWHFPFCWVFSFLLIFFSSLDPGGPRRTLKHWNSIKH